MGDGDRPLGLYVKGFGEDEAGEIYLLASTGLGPSGTTGRIYRIGRQPPDRLPGDCNEDGAVDLSDAVCLLTFLFLGTPGRLPCGDGTAAHPSNRLLMEWTGDGSVDMTDSIAILRWLFLGGRPPAAFFDRTGDGVPDAVCISAPDCPAASSACP